jgi:hypothetical protein
MSILNQKKKIMGNVAALNVITEGLPKFKPLDSFSSINNSTNATDFLMDLIQSLIGYEDLKSNIVDMLTRKLPEIETEIKKRLKIEIKGFVSCGVNPSIPAFLKSTGSGVSIKLPNIDFFESMKIDPSSPFGFLAYSDTSSSLNSKDFNTFLYSNISQNKDDFTPDGGISSPWGASMTGTDIIDLKFSPVGSTENNIIKINANANYDNKTLTEFNNSFIDSISLFGDPNNIDGSKILNTIIDNLFGTMSLQVGKTKKQLKKEAEINECLNCILNSDEGDVIDDSYFEFDNEQLKKIDIEVNNRKNGIRILETCGNLPAQIDIDTLIDVNKSLSAATITGTTDGTSPQEAKVKAMDKAVNTLAEKQAEDSISINIPTVKLNFILELVKGFVKAILNIILSPRLMTLFVLNFKILYGIATQFDGPIDFMKKNKELIKTISKTVLDQLIKMLLTLVLKHLNIKLAKKYADDTIEKGKNYVAQILSLIGVPPEIIRQIQGLNYVGS